MSTLCINTLTQGLWFVDYRYINNVLFIVTNRFKLRKENSRPMLLLVYIINKTSFKHTSTYFSFNRGDSPCFRSVSSDLIIFFLKIHSSRNRPCKHDGPCDSRSNCPCFVNKAHCRNTCRCAKSCWFYIYL